MHSDLTFYRPDTGLFMVGTKKLKGNYGLGFYPVLNQLDKYRKKSAILCDFLAFLNIDYFWVKKSSLDFLFILDSLYLFLWITANKKLTISNK